MCVLNIKYYRSSSKEKQFLSSCILFCNFSKHLILPFWSKSYPQSSYLQHQLWVSNLSVIMIGSCRSPSLVSRCPLKLIYLRTTTVFQQLQFFHSITTINLLRLKLLCPLSTITNRSQQQFSQAALLLVLLRSKQSTE